MTIPRPENVPASRTDLADQVDGVCKKLHVAMFASYIPPHQTECYRALSEQVRRFSIFISTPMERHRPWEHNWNGLDVTVQNTWSIPYQWKHRIGFSEDSTLHLPLDTRHHLCRLRPDVVVSGELGYRTLVCAAHRRRNVSIPFIAWVCVSEHTELGRGIARRMARRWMLRFADAVIVNGSSGRRYIRSLQVSDDRIHEIPYSSSKIGSEHSAACMARGSDPTQRVLLGVGRLSERKGFGQFQKQLSIWCRNNPEQRVRWILVGNGPEANSIAGFAAPANLETILVGEVNHTELAPYYRQADALVFPTLADEWGLVVNEAMMHGLPVMGSRYSAAVEELCQPGVHGWHFDPKDTCDVQKNLTRVMKASGSELRQMSEACLERISFVTPQYCARKFADVVASVVPAVRSTP